MVTLNELQKQADELSSEDRASLLNYLLKALPGAPLGPGDAEVHHREEELESGKVSELSHDEFLKKIGR